MTERKYDFTTTDVVNEVRNLANQHPDFVYTPADDGEGVTGCSYLNGANGKGCIVGQALANLGVSRAELEAAETQNAVAALEVAGLTEPGRVRNYGDWTNEEKFLVLVQQKQDDHTSWGEAVEGSLHQLPVAAVK